MQAHKIPKTLPIKMVGITGKEKLTTVMYNARETPINIIDLKYNFQLPVLFIAFSWKYLSISSFNDWKKTAFLLLKRTFDIHFILG